MKRQILLLFCLCKSSIALRSGCNTNKTFANTSSGRLRWQPVLSEMTIGLPGFLMLTTAIYCSHVKACTGAGAIPTSPGYAPPDGASGRRLAKLDRLLEGTDVTHSSG